MDAIVRVSDICKFSRTHLRRKDRWKQSKESKVHHDHRSVAASVKEVEPQNSDLPSLLSRYVRVHAWYRLPCKAGGLRKGEESA